YPGEPGAVAILEEAFALGLKGVKLHCHVQAFSPDAPQLHELYEACARAGRPLVMHSGREPSSARYPVDPHQLCAAERVERVLKDHPTLKLCVPHLGADEFDAYARLLERHDTLWLDTTMAVGGYFPVPLPRKALELRPERILYGTDFPNIPYAWDRELRALAGLGLDETALAGVLGGNTLSLYGEC
ncbi:MAG: amidohydrolase, partial [Myxococcaceae bacterium]